MRRPMRRALTALAVAAFTAAFPAAGRAAAERHDAPAHSDHVIQWNRFLLGIQATPGDQPATVHPTYELAVVHAAIYDAVVSIDRSATPYLTTVRAPRSASTVAAADAAAHDTMAALYPQLRASIDAEYDTLIAQVPSDRHTDAGIGV